MSVRIPLYDHEVRRVIKYLRSRDEAERLRESGTARVVSELNKPLELALYAPANNERAAKAASFRRAASLAVSPGLVRAAADGNESAQEIFAAYGETAPRHSMELER